MKIIKSKSGHPCLWEYGGSDRDKGFAQVIAGQYGEQLAPIWVNKGGPTANRRHALFVIKKDDYVICVKKDEPQDLIVAAGQIISIDLEAEEAEIKTVADLFDDIPEELMSAVLAAISKCQCYNCRYPHYAAHWEHSKSEEKR